MYTHLYIYTLQFHLIESDRTELLEAVTEKNILADERTTNIGPVETYGQNVSPPLLDICMHFTYNYKLIC